MKDRSTRMRGVFLSSAVSLVAGLLSCLPSAPALAAGVPSLQVEGVSGNVDVQRLGTPLTPRSGLSLHEGDVVEVGLDSRLSLVLDGRGAFQAVGVSRFSVETLPAARAPDAPTILSLDHGRLHLLWQGAADDARRASLYVYTAGHRAGLAGGEYFLSREGGRTRLCVVSGAAELRALNDDVTQNIAASTCWTESGSAPAHTAAADDGTWQNLSRIFAAPAAVPAAQLTASAAAPSPPGAGLKFSDTLQDAAAPEQDRAPAATGGAWAINVASYTDEGSARMQRRHLAESGYDAVVVPARVDGRTWYRVQLTGFSSPDAARSRAAVLKDDLGARQLWVMRRP